MFILHVDFAINAKYGVLMNTHAYLLSSDELELLLAFETATSLENLSKTLSKDISNISRSLKRIFEKLPVIEKQSNRWQITDLGRQLNLHTRDSIQYQKSLLQQQAFLRIGTNREFASRILGPKLNELQKIFPDVKLRICSFESGVEKALLDSQIDIGIDCERPFSPDIGYKIAFSDDLVIVCSSDFKARHQKNIKAGGVFDLPHLLCDRLYPDIVFKKTDNKLNVFASFNDIATTRAACIAGCGWALMPKYAVISELCQKQLIIIDGVDVARSSYGVWKLRRRKTLDSYCLKLQNFLTNISK